MEDINDYKGMSLFKDVENPTLRARNRGVVMGNIAIDGLIPNSTGTLAPKAAADLLKYFREIPSDERKPALQVFLDYCQQQGYTVTKYV